MRRAAPTLAATACWENAVAQAPPLVPLADVQVIGAAPLPRVGTPLEQVSPFGAWLGIEDRLDRKAASG